MHEQSCTVQPWISKTTRWSSCSSDDSKCGWDSAGPRRYSMSNFLFHNYCSCDCFTSLNVKGLSGKNYIIFYKAFIEFFILFSFNSFIKMRVRKDKCISSLRNNLQFLKIYIHFHVFPKPSLFFFLLVSSQGAFRRHGAATIPFILHQRL